MAGAGKRMGPHTLTPKVLLPIAGNSIVQRLVEDITHMSAENVDEISFINRFWNGISCRSSCLGRQQFCY